MKMHERLHHNHTTVSGKPLEWNYSDAECFDPGVIVPLKRHFKEETGLAVLQETFVRTVQS